MDVCNLTLSFEETKQNMSKLMYKGIEQLGEGNYRTWAMKVQAYIMGQKWYTIAIENNEPGLNAPNNAHDTWSEKNALCLSFLFQTITDYHLEQYRGELKAKVIWDDLKDRFADDNLDMQINIFEKITNLKWDTSETLEAYFSKVRGLQRSSSQHGRVISDKEICKYALKGVNRSGYETIKSILEEKSDNTLKTVELSLTRKFKQLHEEGGVRAYQASSSQVNPSHIPSLRPSSGSNIKCWTCGGPHKKSACQDSSKDAKACSFCGKTNHERSQCWKLKKAGTTGSNPSLPRRDKHANATIVSEDVISVSRATLVRPSERLRAHGAKLKGSTSRIKSKVLEFEIDSGCDASMTVHNESIDARPTSIVVEFAGKGSESSANFVGDVELQSFQCCGRIIEEDSNIILCIYCSRVKR